MDKNINKLRLSKKNDLQNKINDIDKKISYYIKSLTTIKNSSMNIDFVSNKLKETEEKIKRLNEEKTETLNDLEKANSGFYDNDMKQNIQINTDTFKEKHNKTIIKKVDRENRVKEEKKNFNRCKTEERMETRKYYRQQREIRNEFYTYVSLCKNTPNYMKKNLKTMPNNKGYIYNGLYLFGEAPRENNDITVMFEKPNFNTLWIHEWNKNEYIKYEKVGTARKKIIDKQPIMKKKKMCNLLVI